MKKNPRHFVTCPDVFKFPWIAVQPESFLQPGNVFYIVPFHTIRGLLRHKAFPYELLNQQESLDSSGSEDEDSECASELFQLRSCPYDSSSESIKIVNLQMRARKLKDAGLVNVMQETSRPQKSTVLINWVRSCSSSSSNKALFLHKGFW